MADAKLKPLYMAKSLEELNKKIGGEKTKFAAPKTLCRLVEKIFLKARDAQLSGDEEQAYVLFMRVGDAFSNIRKSRDYKTNKKEFDALLPSSRAIQAFETADTLSESLKERYSALAGPSGKKIKLEKSTSSDDSADKIEDQVVPSPTPLSAKDVYKLGKNATLVPQSSVSSDQNDVDVWFGNETGDTTASGSSHPPTLTPQQLYAHLQRAPDDVLVLDCRPRADFLASHVDGKKYPQWLSVPEETVMKGVTSESAGVFLNPAGKKQWKERQKKEVVVLVDEGSTAEGLGESPDDSTPILALKDAITKWDISAPLAREPLILEGGYGRWYLTYSPLCLGKPRRKEKQPSDGDASGLVDKKEVSVDYPSFPSLSEAEPPKGEEQTSPSQTAAGTEPQAGGPMSPTRAELVPRRPVPATPTDLPSPAPAAPIPTSGVPGNPAAPLPAIFPSYGPLPPLPSAIPVALTLEGEAALLTPSLSSDDNLILNVPRAEPAGVIYPGMEPYPMTGMEQYTVNGMEPFPMATTGVPANIGGGSFQHGHQPGFQVQNAPHPAVSRGDIYYPSQQPQNFIQPPSMPHQVHEPGYIPVDAQPSQYVEPAAFRLKHTGMPSHHPYQGAQPLQQVTGQPEAGFSGHVGYQYDPGMQNFAMQQQQPHPQPMQQQQQQLHPQPMQQHQPHPQPMQQQQPHPQPMQQPYLSELQPGQMQPHLQPMQQQQQPHLSQMQHHPMQLQPHPSDVQQGQMQPQPAQPHPTLMQQPAVQPQPHPPPMQQPAVQPQPHPPPMQHAVQPHPSLMQQPVIPQPPTSMHQPQPHPHPVTMQQPAAQPQPHPPPMQPHLQPHPPEIQQQHNQPQPHPHPSHTGPPPATVHPESNPRVAQGPIPNPPSYSQALNYPPHPPVQPPIPPPASQLNQPNQFVQNEQPPQQGMWHHEGAGDPRWRESEAEARIVEIQKRLDERISALESQKHTAVKDLKDSQLQHEQETTSIQEMRDQLERERENLAREKEQHQMELEQERVRARDEIQQQREHVSETIARERQQLAAERERHQREMEQQQREFVALREQFEREKSQMTQKQEEMKHWELRQRQEESQRLFTLSQGLPSGWEKRLDRATGRFYYVDHGSHTTHWNPPTNWLTYQAEAQRQKELQEQKSSETSGTPRSQGQVQPQVQPGSVPHPVVQPDPKSVPHPALPPGPGATGAVAPQQQPPRLQPGSTPVSTVSTTPVPASIAPGQPRTRSGMEPRPRQLGPTPTPAQRPTPTTAAPPQPRRDQKLMVPTVDRSTKPRIQPTVDRSAKPMTMAVYRKKLENLQPVFGSTGHALTGLRNLGNTCFMSSVLQCLCGTTPLVTHFLSGRFRNDINRSNPLGMRGEIAEEFNFLVKNMWCGEYRSISPRDFKFTISKFAPQFSGNAQQDSQEFLAFLMDGLHEDLNRVQEKRYIEEKDNHGIQDPVAAEMAWQNHKKRNDSVIVDLFQGQFRSTVVCLSCRQRSVTFEAFMYLSVPIPPGAGGYRVEDCIRLFTKEEKVSGSDRWFCSSCKAHREASKRIEIWKLPPILLIHLKRFSFEGMWRQKKQNFVDFPLNSLDMSSHVVGMKPPRQYHLYGVSNHYGTMSGGHYTAYCINPYKRKFYCFDDHEVKDIAPRQVKSAAAYLLFYTSIDFTPPRIFSGSK